MLAPVNIFAANVKKAKAYQLAQKAEVLKNKLSRFSATELDEIITLAKRLKLNITSSTKQDIKRLKHTMNDRINKIEKNLKIFKQAQYKKISSWRYNRLNELYRKAKNLASKYDKLKALLNSKAKTVATQAGSLDKIMTTSIEDLLNCKNTGTNLDTRPASLQYFCNEIPVGNTGVYGLTYQKYLKNPAAYNKAHNDMVLKNATYYTYEDGKKFSHPVPINISWDKKEQTITRRLTQKERCAYIKNKRKNSFGRNIANPYYKKGLQNQCAFKKLSSNQFKQYFALEYSEWKSKKLAYDFPFKYKDLVGQRNEGLKLVAERIPRGKLKVTSMQYKKGTTSGYLSGCFTIPGSGLYKSEKELSYRITKWWKEKAIITTPNLKFDSASMCALLKVDALAKNKIQLISMTSPKLSGLKLSALKINFSGGILKLVNNALSMMTLGLIQADKLASKLAMHHADKDGKITKALKDMKSGQYFADDIRNSMALIFKGVSSDAITTNQKTHDEKVENSMASVKTYSPNYFSKKFKNWMDQSLQSAGKLNNKF